MAYRLNLTKEQEDRIAEVCRTGEKTITALSLELGIGRTVVRREIKEKNLYASIVRNPKAGIPIVWTSQMLNALKEGYTNTEITVEELASSLGIHATTAQEKAKELGLSKLRKTVWDTKNLARLQELAQSCNILQISEALNLCDETVRKKVKELQIEIKHKFSREGKIIFKGSMGSFTKEIDCFSFITAIANPSLSTNEIAHKFNIAPYAVTRSRKKLFPKFYSRIDYCGANFSNLELKFKDVLDELDIVFTRSKKIGKFSVDFYLGNKLCIELDGNYYHASLKRKKRDLRKSMCLIKNGYKLLRIKEDELLDTPSLKIKVLKFVKGHP